MNDLIVGEFILIIPDRSDVILVPPNAAAKTRM